MLRRSADDKIRLLFEQLGLNEMRRWGSQHDVPVDKKGSGLGKRRTVSSGALETYGQHGSVANAALPAMQD